MSAIGAVAEGEHQSPEQADGVFRSEDGIQDEIAECKHVSVSLVGSTHVPLGGSRAS
jgi:hypothetical protein